MEQVSTSIERFITDCEVFDELPHSFDDSLVDKLVGSLRFDEGHITTLVEKLIRNVDFEMRCVPLQIILQIVDASLQHDVSPDVELLRQFVTSSEDLLEQGRPPKLVHGLLTLYSNPSVFGLRRADEWRNVLQWSLSMIDDERTSVFVRRQLQSFICKFSANDARRIMILSGVIQIFCKRLQSPQISAHIIDATTRILEYFVYNLDPEECTSIVERVRLASRVGENTLRLVVTIKKSHPAMSVPFLPQHWKNESNRVDTVTLLMAGEDPVEGEKELIVLVLLSPACQLRHHIELFHRMDEEQKTTLLEKLSSSTLSGHKISDIVQFILKTSNHLSTPMLVRLLTNLGSRALESSRILASIKAVYGSGFFDLPEVAEYKTRIAQMLDEMILSSEWEVVDTVLEVYWMFPVFSPGRDAILSIAENNPSSPYVLTASLRILRDCCGGVPFDLAKNIVLTSPDPAPRLFAIKSIVSLDKIVDVVEADVLCSLVETCLQEYDVLLRSEALKLARECVERGNTDTQVAMRRILDDWNEDAQIGSEVCELLGKSSVERDEGPMHLIEEMLTALCVHRNEDDTMDCY